MLSHDSSMKHVYSAQNGALLQGCPTGLVLKTQLISNHNIRSNLQLIQLIMLDHPVQTFMGWLRKDDLQLKVTASLAIGNFACSDEHTEQLVDEVDAAENLVGLLRSQVSGLEERHAFNWCIYCNSSPVQGAPCPRGPGLG